MLGRARLGLLDRPTAHKGETTQPSTEPRVECERELISEKCSICKTKILFGVLCLKCRRNYWRVVFLVLNASIKGKRRLLTLRFAVILEARGAEKIIRQQRLVMDNH